MSGIFDGATSFNQEQTIRIWRSRSNGLPSVQMTELYENIFS
jgi:hypothetical protein